MSINVFLPELKQQKSNVHRLSNHNTDAMYAIKSSILEFTDERTLKGESYDSAKAYFTGVYIPLCNGIRTLSESLSNAHTHLVERYVSEVDTNSLQSDILENQIQRLGAIAQRFEELASKTPAISTGAQNSADIYRQQQLHIQRKLEKLLNFDPFSASLFNETEILLSKVHQALAEISQGKAWNAKTNMFDIHSINMEPFELINEIAYQKDMEHIEKLLELFPDITKEEMKNLYNLMAINQNSNIPPVLLEKIKELFGLSDFLGEAFQLVKGDISWGDILTDGLDAISYAMIQYGESVAIYGPNNGFILHTSRSASIFKNGNKVSQISSYLGHGLALISTLWGTYKDVSSGEKTVGEAVVKNTTKTAMGLGAVAMVASTTTPVGWAFVGTAAVSFATSKVFDFAYNSNFLGIQSGLDAVGNIVDNYVVSPLIDVYDWSKVQVKEIGASISGAWETINPLNWGW